MVKPDKKCMTSSNLFKKEEFQSQDEMHQQLNESLLYAVSRGDIDQTSYWLEQGADPSVWGFSAVRRAGAQGYSDCLSVLLRSPALQAALAQNPAIVQASMSTMTLWGAICGGHAECVSILLPWVDWGSMGEDLSGLAASRGSISCLSVLMEAREPSEKQLEEWIELAKRGHHSPLVGLLHAKLERKVLEACIPSQSLGKFNGTSKERESL